MTHDRDVDDGDLEIEQWEIADAELAAQGWSYEMRALFWIAMRSPEQVEHERLIGAVMEELNCSEEEAHRILFALDGKEL